MQPSFELFDHTADMGVRVRADTLPALLKPAIDGLYTCIGTLVPGDDAGNATFRMTDGDPADLLRDFLAELLHRFERDGHIAVELNDVTFDETRLSATAQLRLANEDRSTYHREVKAVTYHELAIRPVPGGFEATFIVDI